MKALEIGNVKITSGFWKEYQELILKKVIPYQWDILNDKVKGIEKSHAIDNFRIAAGISNDKFYGEAYQDSDLYKWLEAVGNALQVENNIELEKKADEVIDLLEGAQEEDGYLNTYFQLVEPEKKWSNILECHELYCAGHLIEAAIAYYKGTGKDKILKIACKLADCINEKFGPEEWKMHGYPGHQELELALVKLYDLTNENKYLKLAEYFIDMRGTNQFFEEEFIKRKRICHWTKCKVEEPNRRYNQFPYQEYNQFHQPVRMQKKATGHAVRAVYMYTAMADLAYHNGDKELLDSCKSLWDNITNKQIYINGSIGSTPSGEAFTKDYDLPNDTNYSETCAALGMIFFTFKMLQNFEQSCYADTIEYIFYNAVLSGLGLDGEHFFYANPMEMLPRRSKDNPERNHLKSVRQQWYACSCCPPNIARTLAGLGKYIYGLEEDESILYVNQFINSEATVERNGKQYQVKLETQFPLNGLISITVSGKECSKIAIRYPAWSTGVKVKKNGQEIFCERSETGYILVDLDSQESNRIDLEFQMEPIIIAANRKISYDARKAAIIMGPLLYCFESVDNGTEIEELGLYAQGELETKRNSIAGKEINTIYAKGARRREMAGDTLYGVYQEMKEDVKLTAIPYFLWNNRGEGEMKVWIPVE